jgi:hypothetical protein
MRTYKAIAGQSIYDVCLQTYGTLDLIYKMMQDNGVNGLNEPVLSGQAFVWDESLVQDQQLNAAFVASGKIYATDVSNYGSVFYVINNTGSIVPNNPGTPYLPPSNTENQYQMVLSTSFTSNQDNLTSFTPLDINGNTLVGFDIVQIELNIQPLKASDFVWNKSFGVCTLLNGLTIDNGSTAYILYSKIVTA